MTRESLTLTIAPSGELVVGASNLCRAWLKEHRDTHDEVSALWTLTEPYWTNGGFWPFDAGEARPFVGLTSAPCIAEDMTVHDDGEHEIIGRLWWFPDYMVRSPIDELIRRGRTVFQAAP